MLVRDTEQLILATQVVNYTIKQSSSQYMSQQNETGVSHQAQRDLIHQIGHDVEWGERANYLLAVRWYARISRLTIYALSPVRIGGDFPLDGL